MCNRVQSTSCHVETEYLKMLASITSCLMQKDWASKTIVRCPDVPHSFASNNRQKQKTILLACTETSAAACAPPGSAQTLSAAPPRVPPAPASASPPCSPPAPASTKQLIFTYYVLLGEIPHFRYPNKETDVRFSFSLFSSYLFFAFHVRETRKCTNARSAHPWIITPISA